MNDFPSLKKDKFVLESADNIEELFKRVKTIVYEYQGKIHPWTVKCTLNELGSQIYFNFLIDMRLKQHGLLDDEE